MNRATVVGASAVILPVSVVIGMATWCMQAPAIPQWQMEKMRVGMTSREVTELLGTPGSKYAVPDGSERWVYSRHTWAMYNVWIGPDGTVVQHEHDF